MCKRDLDKIIEFVNEHLEERKYLNSWYSEINEILPRNKRVSKRELAFIFNRVLKNKFFDMEHTTYPIQYRFSELTS